MRPYAEDFTGWISFDEAANIIRNLPRVAIYVSCQVELVTEPPKEDDTYRTYNYPTSVEVGRKQALKLIEGWADFSQRKVDNGQAGAVLRVSVRPYVMRRYAGDDQDVTYHTIHLG